MSELCWAFVLKVWIAFTLFMDTLFSMCFVFDWILRVCVFDSYVLCVWILCVFCIVCLNPLCVVCLNPLFSVCCVFVSYVCFVFESYACFVCVLCFVCCVCTVMYLSGKIATQTKCVCQPNCAMTAKIFYSNFEIMKSADQLWVSGPDRGKNTLERRDLNPLKDCYCKHVRKKWLQELKN